MGIPYISAKGLEALEEGSRRIQVEVTPAAVNRAKQVLSEFPGISPEAAEALKTRLVVLNLTKYIKN